MGPSPSQFAQVRNWHVVSASDAAAAGDARVKVWVKIFSRRHRNTWEHVGKWKDGAVPEATCNGRRTRLD